MRAVAPVVLGLLFAVPALVGHSAPAGKLSLATRVEVHASPRPAVTHRDGEGFVVNHRRIPAPEPAWPPGRIAFVRNGHLWLWESGKEWQLTRGTGITSPRFSPDGRYIAYWQNGRPWVLTTGGAGPWPVDVEVPIPGDLVWAPTGSTFALTGRDGVITVDVNDKGSQPPRLVAKGWSDPAWSSDGQWLAVARAVPGEKPFSGTNLIALASRTSGKPVVIMEVPAPHESACGPVGSGRLLRWSADDRWLAFYRSGLWASLSTDCNELNVLPTRGGKPIPVGVSPANPDWFAWSPEGATLAFTDGASRDAFYNKTVRLAAMPPAAPYRSLTPEGYADREPAWIADGRQVALTRSRAERPFSMVDPAPDQAVWLIDPVSGRGRPVPGSEGAVGPHRGPGRGLLWVRSDQHQASLWYTVTPGEPPRVVLGGMDPAFSYYGQWNWRTLFDWWAPHRR